MSAGAKYEYLWLDEKTKKPVAVPAPDYVGLLMEQIDSKIEDQSLFPASVGVPFPRNYLSEVANRFFSKDAQSSSDTLRKTKTGQDHLQALVQGVCSYLLPSLRPRARARARGVSQYKLQVLLLCHFGVQTGGKKGVGSA